MEDKLIKQAIKSLKDEGKKVTVKQIAYMTGLTVHYLYRHELLAKYKRIQKPRHSNHIGAQDYPAPVIETDPLNDNLTVNIALSRGRHFQVSVPNCLDEGEKAFIKEWLDTIDRYKLS